MAQKTSKKAAEHTKELKQKKLIRDLREKETWMKWSLIVALIIILLLLLFIGYATDWMAGLRKDSATAPGTSTLDSSRQGSGTTPSSAAPTDTTSNGTSTRNNGTSSTGTNSATETSRSNTSTTTTNNSTTNNTTTPPSTPPDSLLNLYADSNVGTSINDLINRANNLGISSSCNDGLLVRECTFSVGEFTISTKNLLGTGLVTSVLKNF